jgi:hypothetical protein
MNGANDIAAPADFTCIDSCANFTTPAGECGCQYVPYVPPGPGPSPGPGPGPGPAPRSKLASASTRPSGKVKPAKAFR